MNRIAKYILNYIYNEIITHIPIRFVRLSFLRLFNKKIDKNIIILLHTKILNFWNITIKKGAVINQYCLLDCRSYGIEIGEHSDIGPYTKIWTLGHDPDNAEHGVYGGDVLIGHHVWVASNVTILPKVSLANGTVVASCAVVHKSTEENDIIAGNPASFKRKRLNTLGYKISWNPLLQ